jgi:hypothetical protein
MKKLLGLYHRQSIDTHIRLSEGNSECCMNVVTSAADAMLKPIGVVTLTKGEKLILCYHGPPRFYSAPRIWTIRQRWEGSRGAPNQPALTPPSWWYTSGCSHVTQPRSGFIWWLSFMSVQRKSIQVVGSWNVKAVRHVRCEGFQWQGNARISPRGLDFEDKYIQSQAMSSRKLSWTWGVMSEETQTSVFKW